MKANMKFTGLLAAGAIGLLAAASANASITLTFDAADSNIAAGHYDFTLAGITATPTFNSTFELLNFSLIGSTSANPIATASAPSGWVFDSSGSLAFNQIEWLFQNTSGAFNGNFDITAA